MSKIETALNTQMNREHQAFYFYLAGASHFEAQNLEGVAKWMRAQAEEEMSHAKRYHDFLLRTNRSVVYGDLTAPKITWNNSLDAFNEALSHEKAITKTTHELLDLAHAERDYPCIEFLQWFVQEQVEEEDSIQSIIDRINLMHSDNRSDYFLDKELGKKVLAD